MKNRRGYTLIEMMTVMVVASVLLTTAAGLLHTLFQWQEAGRERLKEQLAMDRLTRQFRDDAHAATGLLAAEVAAAGQTKVPGWRLQLEAGRTIEYWVAGDALLRRERDRDKPVAREDFALPPSAKVEIGLQADAKPPLARLRITAAAAPSRSPLPPVLLVEGVLGLDQRFAATVGEVPAPPERKKQPP